MFPLVPSGVPSIGATQFVYKLATSPPDTDFDVNLYRSSSDLFDLDTGDWGHLDTLETSFNTAGLVYDEWNEVTIGALSEGGDTFICASSRDISQTPPTYQVIEEIQLSACFKLYTE
jgi:hypothetical protein